MDKLLAWSPLTEKDLPILQKWYQQNVMHTYGGPDAPSTCFALANGKDRFAYVIRLGKTIVGLVEVEVLDGIGWIGLAVSPELHNQSLGRKILRMLPQEPTLGHLREFRAGIDPKHTPSIRCFLAAGFTPLGNGPDHEGILNFSFRRME